MPEKSGFLVEDFIQSITTQLDKVQDVLRLKALTRPLTYALKDFALDLNVFVDMDADGNVRFRTSGPNESGASVVRIGFTTITKPMIEENTVSLALTKSPMLDEMGLERDERRRLEQLGIRNAAQLQQLRQSTSTTTISRYTGVPVNRLRQAMLMGQPFVGNVTPEPRQPSPATGKTRTQQPTPTTRAPGERSPSDPPRPGNLPIRDPIRPGKIVQPAIRVTPDTRRLRLSGGNLLNMTDSPNVRLAGQSLSVDVLDDDEMIVQLPPQHQGGTLEIELPQGETLAYDLSVDGSPFPEETWADSDLAESAGTEIAVESESLDPWSPQRGAD
jgi:hypothetical protein